MDGPTIRVETREVILPVQVIEIRKDPKGLLVGADGTEQYVYIVHSNEVTGLLPKSFHIVEDGIEQRIQHFSVESDHLWVVQDNVGQHFEYSCTPKGIWAGPDKERISIIESLRIHTYLLTYMPSPSPEGTCHHISVKVNHKHATIFAPSQYCNTKDPLSDPLNGGDLGKRLLEFANSLQGSPLPLAAQLVPSFGSTGAYRVNVFAAIPGSLLERKWEGIHLNTSIAVLALVYDKNNLLVSRFSDIACAPSESDVEYNGPAPPGKNPVPWLSGFKGWEVETIPTTYQTQFELGPGEYRLELVLTDGEKFGRTTVSFRLGDIVKDGLAISGIALCSRYRPASVAPRSASQAPQYVPLVFEGTEFTPAGDARFRKGQKFISFFEISGAQLKDTAATMHLETKITDAMTGEVKLDSGLQPLKFSPRPVVSGPFPVVREISIDSLPPGSYYLEAQVSDSEGHKTAWSSASFAVE